MPDEYGTCRSCPAAIRWARTNTGKASPLDREPTPDGNVALMTTEGGTADDVFAVTLSGYALERARHLGVPLRLSHFATCPNRQRHRK